jgi:hypothetical protein
MFSLIKLSPVALVSSPVSDNYWERSSGWVKKKKKKKKKTQYKELK